MKLDTERLSICDFSPDMARDVHLNSLDEDTRRFLPDEVFETEEDALETVNFLIGCYGGEEGPFVHPVFTRKGEENVGYVQLCPAEGGWEIGYHIAKKYTGNGYATEAARAFLKFQTRERGLTEVWGVCLKENTASLRVLEKLGFRLVFDGEGEYQGELRPIVKAVWKNGKQE